MSTAHHTFLNTCVQLCSSTETQHTAPPGMSLLAVCTDTPQSTTSLLGSPGSLQAQKKYYGGSV